MIYRARTIKRGRRTKERVEQLDDQIIEVLEIDQPQSVRHVFYRMTDPRLPEPVEKSDRGYRHVQDRCVKLRRSGRLPYGWISDATRRGYHTSTYTNAAEFVRTMAGHFRADLWRDAECYCEVWVESRSLAGVLQRECQDLAVSLYPAGGFSSITLAYQAAEEINSRDNNKPVKIFYIGDYDPAGVLIDVALERELRKHLRDDIEMTFTRLGITEEQIREHALPSKPRKVTDQRSLHIAATVEAEAMPAWDMRYLLRTQIQALLPQEALSVAHVVEWEERHGLELMAKAFEEAKARRGKS